MYPKGNNRNGCVDYFVDVLTMKSYDSKHLGILLVLSLLLVIAFAGLLCLLRRLRCSHILKCISKDPSTTINLLQ